MLHWKRFICLGLTFLFAQAAKSQEPYSKHYSISNGLPANAVYSILEDSTGFIWFTCEEGLFRYDGMHYKPYRAENQTTFSGSSIMKDATGRIWYQNFDGNSFYVQDEQLILYPQLSKSDYYPLRATEKYIFLQEIDSLIAVDLKTLRPYKKLWKNGTYYACAAVKNTYYYVLGTQLFAISPALKQTAVCSLPMKENEMPILFSDATTLYFTKKSSTESGIWKIENKTHLKIIDLSPDIIIQNVKILENKIYLMTSQGIYLYNLADYSPIRHFDISKSISDILYDRKGNFWTTSNMDGIFLAPDLNIQQKLFEDIFPLRGIAYGNSLFLTSKNEKILRYDTQTEKTELLVSGSKSALPYFIYVDSLNEEIIYVQSDGNAYFFNLKTRKNTGKFAMAIKDIRKTDEKYYALVSPGFIGFYCHAADLEEPSEYDTYISSLARRTEGDIILFQLPIQGRGKSIYIHEKEQKIYFLTNVGVYVWEKGNIQEFKSGGKSLILNTIFEWDNLLMGFGPNGQLEIISPATEIQRENIRDIFRITLIKQIQCIGNKLILRTRNDIYAFEKDAAGKTTLLDKFDLTSQECNDFVGIGNSIWILTTNGLIKWEYALQKNLPLTGKFHVLESRVNGIPIWLPENSTLHFSYTENSISIDFALLDFGDKTIETVEYKINNQDWVTIDPNVRTLNFPALTAGFYTIRIRGLVNGKYVDFEKYTFHIHPPFWSTIWFIASVILLASLLIILYFRKRIRSTRYRAQLNQEKIQLEADLNKSLLASIKSQMNPHFIFNALNTIQAYIYMNDKENASGYLSKFSKLTRSILELSEKDVVLLSEEVDALKLYLDLEKMRFQQGFSYTIAALHINLDEVKIPSMLIQPYVENAIKHGLLHSTREKELKITFRLEENMLLVEVDDNGIGRKWAEELRIQRDKIHAGFSTQANEKRLKLLSHNSRVVVTYTDKMDSDGKALGTTVNLTIQLK